MSYILDALRRAEAERRRGEPPALDQVARWPGLDAAPARPHDGRIGWLLGLGAVLCLALAALAWWAWMRPPPTPGPAAAAPLTPTLSPRGEGASAPAGRVSSLSRGAGEGRGEGGGSAKPTRPAPRQSPAPAPARPPASAASAPEPPPVSAAALPEPQRGALARLGLAGGVYSPEPSQRFVLVGGQIAHEGDTLAPGIVLERIQPRSALLRVDGRQVEMPL